MPPLYAHQSVLPDSNCLCVSSCCLDFTWTCWQSLFCKVVANILPRLLLVLMNVNEHMLQNVALAFHTSRWLHKQSWCMSLRRAPCLENTRTLQWHRTHHTSTSKIHAKGVLSKYRWPSHALHQDNDSGDMSSSTSFAILMSDRVPLTAQTTKMDLLAQARATTVSGRRWSTYQEVLPQASKSLSTASPMTNARTLLLFDITAEVYRWVECWFLWQRKHALVQRRDSEETKSEETVKYVRPKQVCCAPGHGLIC